MLGLAWLQACTLERTRPAKSPEKIHQILFMPCLFQVVKASERERDKTRKNVGKISIGPVKEPIFSRRSGTGHRFTFYMSSRSSLETCSKVTKCFFTPFVSLRGE